MHNVFHAMIATPEIHGIIKSMFECFYTDISKYAVTSEKCAKTLYRYDVILVEKKGNSLIGFRVYTCERQRDIRHGQEGRC